MMRMEECYRSLGLRPGASRIQIKAAYRTLARQLHPDRQTQRSQTHSASRFIQITQAYRQLMNEHQPPVVGKSVGEASSLVNRAPVQDPLKYQTYQRLRHLFTQGRFANAIALVDGLAQRLPSDPEVRQWQALAYQQLGLRLMHTRQYPQAIAYLQKSIATDPTNLPLKTTSHQALLTIRRQLRPNSR